MQESRRRKLHAKGQVNETSNLWTKNANPPQHRSVEVALQLLGRLTARPAPRLVAPLAPQMHLRRRRTSPRSEPPLATFEERRFSKFVVQILQNQNSLGKFSELQIANARLHN